jgi:hypothetical protein
MSAMRPGYATLKRVIAGLDPAIHGELQFGMDHRVKPGGDETLGAILGMIPRRPRRLPKRSLVPHSAIRRTG